MRANLQFWEYIFFAILISIATPTHAYNSSDSFVDNECRARDSIVLADFYENTVSDNWRVKWDLSQPMDTWYGVKLNESGCVECLDLDGEAECGITVSFGNGLGGSIPARIGMLDSLKVLCLGNNRITGSIPASIFELEKLEIFDLFGNEIIGPLPAIIGNATNLRVLSLAGNNLIGPIPASIGDLKFLEELYLSDNNLIGPLPSRFSEAKNLRRLRLNNNSIGGQIPSEFGELTNLVTLNLADNLLEGEIPSELGQLLMLKDLYLADNNLISNFPEEIGNCLGLVRLRFCHNSLTGEIPASVGNLTNLEQFHINDNNLEGCIPKEIGQCINITDFRVDQNNLSCEIPVEFGHLVNLRIANLSDNQLINQLPRSIGDLNIIRELDVSENRLSGPLPSEFTGMSSLKSFRGQNNKLEGPLPQGLDELTRVIEINLANNKIDGSIPQSYGETSSLNKLYLNNNNLSGCFPASLENDCNKDFDFTQNSELPWEGDLQQFCNGESQTGAPCSSDPTIQDQTIQDDCSCKLFVCTPVNIVQDAFLCVNETISISGQEYGETGQVIESLETSVGCDSIVTYNIVRMDLSIDTANAQCEDDENGTAVISTNVNGIYDYSIKNSAGQEIISGSGKSTLPALNQILAPGQYQLTVRENNMQCAIDTAFTILADHNAAELTYIEGIQCDDQSYEINGALYNQENVSGTEILRTAYGCDSTVIIDLVYLTLATTKTDAICENDHTGTIEGALSNNDIEYTCIITDDNNSEVHNETTFGAFSTGQKLAPGNYRVVMTTVEGCSYTSQVQLESQFATPEPTTLIEEICFGEEISIFGTVYNSDNTTGTAVIQTTQGCDSTIYVELEFYSEALAYDDRVQVESRTVNVDILENDEYDPEAELTLTIIDTAKVSSVQIDGHHLNIEIDEAYAGLSYIEYEICNADCDEICSRARLTILSSIDEYHTGVITPNGDDYNEVMVVLGYEAYEVIEGASINVINRWGQTVYSSDEYKNDWSGNMNGDASKPLPEGVYYYHLTYRDGSSKLGSTSIIR